jgi:hypothetical protein
MHVGFTMLSQYSMPKPSLKLDPAMIKQDPVD